MAHRHTIGIQFTGADIEDEDGTHYHEYGDESRTSSDAEGARHTHTTEDGKKTSRPLPLNKGSKHDKKKKPKGGY